MLPRVALWGTAAFLVLSVGLAAISNRGPLAAPSPFAVCDPTAIEGDPEDISPRFILSGEVGSGGNRDITVTVGGDCDDEDDPQRYITKVVIDAPIFVPGAPPLNEGDPISDSDDLEHVRVYFANEEKRILEIRFNRFKQQSSRLLKKPHNLLRKEEDLPRFHKFDVTQNPTAGRWTGVVEFYSDLLPAQLTRASVMVIDPRQRERSQRYISSYRIYNHPLSLLDLHVVSSFPEVEPRPIVPEGPNYNDTTWWEGM